MALRLDGIDITSEKEAYSLYSVTINNVFGRDVKMRPTKMIYENGEWKFDMFSNPILSYLAKIQMASVKKSGVSEENALRDLAFKNCNKQVPTIIRSNREISQEEKEEITKKFCDKYVSRAKWEQLLEAAKRTSYWGNLYKKESD